MSMFYATLTKESMEHLTSWKFLHEENAKKIIEKLYTHTSQIETCGRRIDHILTTDTSQTTDTYTDINTHPHSFALILFNYVSEL